MAYATAIDIADRLGRDLDESEERIIEARLEDVEALILQRIPDLNDRVNSGKLNERLVVMAEADALMRLIKNPDGYRQETDGNYCLAPESLVLTAGLEWVPVGTLLEGDGLVGFDEEPTPKRRRLRRSLVENVGRDYLPSYRVTLTDDRSFVASSYHKWLGGKGRNIGWVDTQDLVPGREIRDLGVPWEFDDSREAAYLAGVYDGEGSIDSTAGFRTSFPQRPGAVMERTKIAMKERGFPIGEAHLQKSGVEVFYLTSTYENMRFIGSVRPTRFLENSHLLWADKALRTDAATVATVEYVGNQEVVTIGTSTKTLFVEGLASHNSYTIDASVASGRLSLLPEEWQYLGVRKSIVMLAPGIPLAGHGAEGSCRCGATNPNADFESGICYGCQSGGGSGGDHEPHTAVWA